jgi:hypothetical protein
MIPINTSFNNQALFIEACIVPPRALVGELDTFYTQTFNIQSNRMPTLKVMYFEGDIVA